MRNFRKEEKFMQSPKQTEIKSLKKLPAILVGYLIASLLLVGSIIARARKCGNSDYYAFWITQITYVSLIWLYWQTPDLQAFGGGYGFYNRKAQPFYSKCTGSIGQGDYHNNLHQNFKFFKDSWDYKDKLFLLLQLMIWHFFLIIFTFAWH